MYRRSYLLPLLEGRTLRYWMLYALLCKGEWSSLRGVFLDAVVALISSLRPTCQSPCSPRYCVRDPVFLKSKEPMCSFICFWCWSSCSLPAHISIFWRMSTQARRVHLSHFRRYVSTICISRADAIMGRWEIRPEREPLLWIWRHALFGVGLHSPSLGAVTRPAFAAINTLSTLHLDFDQPNPTPHYLHPVAKNFNSTHAEALEDGTERDPSLPTKHMDRCVEDMRNLTTPPNVRPAQPRHHWTTTFQLPPCA